VIHGPQDACTRLMTIPRPGLNARRRPWPSACRGVGCTSRHRNGWMTVTSRPPGVRSSPRTFRFPSMRSSMRVPGRVEAPGPDGLCPLLDVPAALDVLDPVTRPRPGDAGRHRPSHRVRKAVATICQAGPQLPSLGTRLFAFAKRESSEVQVSHTMETRTPFSAPALLPSYGTSTPAILWLRSARADARFMSVPPLPSLTI
jgi:hypothetical protein